MSILAAVSTGAFGTGFWLLRDRGPSADEVEAGARRLRELTRPGDLVLILPFYATRAREWLGDLDPVAPKNPLAEDFDTHARVAVFSLFGAVESLDPELERMGLARARRESPKKGITLDVYTVSSTRTVTYSFRDHLAQARVTYEQPDGKLEACDRYGDEHGRGGVMGRWSCRRDAEWFYVGREWHRMGDHPRLCLWAHPPNAGRLRIEFPGVPLATRLAGRAGHTLNSSLHARQRVDLEVEIMRSAPHGQGSPIRETQQLSFALRETWRPFSILTPFTGTATVTFSVSSPDAGANHFCFDASIQR